MDDLNRFMTAERFPREMQSRLRAYFHQRKHVQIRQSHREVVNKMSTALQVWWGRRAMQQARARRRARTPSGLAWGSERVVPVVRACRAACRAACRVPWSRVAPAASVRLDSATFHSAIFRTQRCPEVERERRRGDQRTPVLSAGPCG
eukprot:3061477-Prymnesium_polylepis.1